MLGEHRYVLYTLLLLVPAFGMHTPIAGESISLSAAILVLAYEWKRINVDAELKRILVLLVVYLLAFTILSDDHARSVKGSYDILRGLVFFPVGMLLAQYSQRNDVSLLLKISVTALVLAQFVYPRESFFGFYVNPNNVAVTLVFLLALSLPTRRSTGFRSAEILVSGVGLLTGLYLLVLTNSRGAWLGCALAAGALVFCTKTLSTRTKVALVVLVAAALVGALYFLNYKGLELTLRDVIWEGLLNETLRSKPWLGYGINYTKELLPAINVPFQTTHNLFLEFFVSSGLVGLAFMIYIFYRLARHFLSFDFEQTAIFYSGLFGLLAFLVMDQFDLKFASYRFFGTHCFFLGLIYSHRRTRADVDARVQNAVAP